MRLRRWCVPGLVLLAGLATAQGGEFEPGKGWVSLFDGKTLKGWKAHGRGSSAWRVDGGVLANPQRSTNLHTERKFTDFQLHVEFKINHNGNSGVYLRGRKEVQIFDSFATADKALKYWDCGGIYSLHAPSTNACKAPGEWQTLDITVVGRTVTVALNGVTVVDKKTVDRPTGGQIDNNEGQAGPIMLQGDHAPAWFRSLWIKPLP